MVHLSEQDQQRISQAVLEAERHTTGEILPMVVSRSDDYPGARWRLAIVTALLSGFLAYSLLDNHDPAWILWTQIPGLYVGYWLGGFGAILRPFLISARLDEEVHQRALQAFFAHNLHATQERTAVLIMVSLLEHRVEILADTGISTRVSDDQWQQIVSDLLGRIKSADLTEGLCVAVRECGDLLAKEFPGAHDNPDELSNQVIIND